MNIKSISAKNLKGQSFNRDIGQHTLIIGPNGSGKTSMNLALQLAVNGYVAGEKPVKTNPEILSNFGSTDILAVGISNGQMVNRQWTLRKGSVKQDYIVGGRKKSKDKYTAALVGMGSPKIFDVSAFMQLSDQKKIDLIFDLFPPAGDVNKLTEDIESLSEDLNTKRRKLRDKENFVAECATNRAKLELPAGTLAEVSAEIESLNKKLSAAEDDLKKAEIARAEEEARKKAENEAQEKRDKARQESEKRLNNGINGHLMTEYDRDMGKAGDMVVTKETGAQTRSEPFFDFKSDDEIWPKGKVTEPEYVDAQKNLNGAIRNILDAMDQVGCSACAASLVAKREMIKLQGGAK